MKKSSGGGSVTSLEEINKLLSKDQFEKSFGKDELVSFKVMHSTFWENNNYSSETEVTIAIFEGDDELLNRTKVYFSSLKDIELKV